MTGVDETADRARLWFFRTWAFIGIMVVLWGVFHVFHAPLRLLTPPIALAGVLVYLLNPVVSYFERRHIHRVVGTLLTYLLVGLMLAGAMWAIAPLIYEQTRELIDGFPDIAVGLQDGVNGQLERLGSDVRVSFDPEASDTREAVQNFIDEHQGEFLGLLQSTGRFVLTILAGILGIILAPVIAFYILVDLPRLSAGVERLLPPESRAEVVDVAGRILGTVGSYIRGQALVSLFVGVGTSIGLGVIGLPFWALVGTVAGIFNLIPFIGPFVGGVIGVVIALTVGGGTGQAIAVVVVMVIVQQIDNHVITPNILSRTVHVHPVTIIVSLAVAASMFGIFGMLIVIPAVATLKLMVMYVLVTRVPSMAYLAGDGQELIDGAPVGTQYTLINMGRDLRAAYRRRRGLDLDDD